MPLYVSQYLNIITSHRDTSILFNGISGCIDEITFELGEKIKRLKELKSSLTSDVLLQLDVSDIEFLISRGHLTKLCPSDEQISFVRYVAKMHSLRNKTKNKGSLMIVPTYGCNLKCPYCFQSKIRKENNAVHGVMKKEFVVEIFEKAIPQLFPHTTKLSDISICLYGGEPFLKSNMHAVETIISYTQKNGMSVSAISNATEIHNYLNHFGPARGFVNSVQISFDGGKNHHDTSRVITSGAGTFDLILENIHKLVERKVRVGIRINLIRKSLPTVKSLVKVLKAEELLCHPYVHVYAWAIHSHGKHFDCSACLSNWELSKIIESEVGSIESPTGRRIRRFRSIFSAEKGLTLRRTSYCMRSSSNAYLMDLHGDIYGCYEEAGKGDLRIGNFSTAGKVVWKPKYMANQLRHVAACEPCSHCSLALTCGGGCAYSAIMDHNGSPYFGDCDSHRECAEMAIQKLFENKMENARPTDGNLDDLDVFPNA